MITVAQIRKDYKKYAKCTKAAFTNLVNVGLSFQEWSKLAGTGSEKKAEILLAELKTLATKAVNLGSILIDLDAKGYYVDSDECFLIGAYESRKEIFSADIVKLKNTCAIEEIGDIGLHLSNGKLKIQEIANMVAFSIKEESEASIVMWTNKVTDIDKIKLFDEVAKKCKTFGYKVTTILHKSLTTNNHLKTMMIVKN